MTPSGLGDLLGRLADHPWLVGDRDAGGAEVGRRARSLSIIAIVTANVVGASVVVCFAVFALPKPELTEGHVVLVNVAAAIAYVAVALVGGVALGTRRLERGPDGTRAWLDEGLPPTAAQRAALLRSPLRIMGLAMALWAVAAVAFAALNLAFSGLLALGVGLRSPWAG